MRDPGRFGQRIGDVVLDGQLLRLRLAVEVRFERLFLLEGLQIFQEEEPGSLLGVVQLGGATGLFAEDVVDVLEDLFKHGRWGL